MNAQLSSRASGILLSLSLHLRPSEFAHAWILLELDMEGLLEKSLKFKSALKSIEESI